MPFERLGVHCVAIWVGELDYSVKTAAVGFLEAGVPRPEVKNLSTKYPLESIAAGLVDCVVFPSSEPGIR